MNSPNGGPDLIERLSGLGELGPVQLDRGCGYPDLDVVEGAQDITRDSASRSNVPFEPMTTKSPYPEKSPKASSEQPFSKRQTLSKRAADVAVRGFVFGVPFAAVGLGIKGIYSSRRQVQA
jgi:hypothetical protein